MKAAILLGLAAAAGSVALPTLASAAPTVIADWTFESSLPSGAGPFSPETGAGAATGSHAGAAVYSAPAGNGSSHSFSSNTWAPNDYYQYQVATTGLDDITLTFDQTGSNTGPKDFEVEYSTDGTSFTNVASYSVLGNGIAPNAAWNGTTNQPAYTMSFDLSSIAALNNASAVYLRLANTDTTAINNGANPVAGGGTDRMDNVIISGSAVVPEPASVGILSMLALGGLSRRRRK